MVPSSHFFIESAASEVPLEGLNTHEEVAIVCAVGLVKDRLSCRADFVPCRVSVAAVADVAFALSWVSHSDELVDIATQVSDGLSSNCTVSNSIIVVNCVYICIMH
jgi:hypothetical protein